MVIRYLLRFSRVAVSTHIFLQGMEGKMAQAIKTHCRSSCSFDGGQRAAYSAERKPGVHRFTSLHDGMVLSQGIIFYARFVTPSLFKTLRRRTGSSPDQIINFEQRVTSHQKLRLSPGSVSKSAPDSTYVDTQPDHRSEILYCNDELPYHCSIRFAIAFRRFICVLRS